MKYLTRTINGYPHGAEGKSISDLSGNYCRGEFEATACIERLAEYEAIGTPEECMEAVEKQKAKKPKTMKYEPLVKSGWYYACPSCGDAVGENGYDDEYTQKFDYCSDCGQKLDWGSEEE